MICIAITAVAFDAISSSLPFGSVAYEAEAEVNAEGERLIWLERRWADTLDALREKGESYSDVIIRLEAVRHVSLNGS
jgi:hypothetical protein